MSVIGRLDEQVEAVLINPLNRRERAPDEEAREEPQPPAPANVERDAETPTEPRAPSDGLPVWLL